MSATVLGGGRVRARHWRLRRGLTQALAILLAIFLLVWTLTPLYSMLLVSLEPHSNVFSSHLFPPHPTL
ncbi:MAG: hypothetical protein M0Z28_08960, partial [Rhodospirillales bacterium]|nr:hypothetical protein [Rhodospirillales bacterium]